MDQMTAAPILNINDNEASRYTLEKVLKVAGFEVVSVETGQEGLDQAVALQPALILLDIQLPDINGFEVCRRLKANLVTTAIPVVHITAHPLGTDDKITSLEEGADAYLTFPVERNYLIAVARSLIRLASAERDRMRMLLSLNEKNKELGKALDELTTEKKLTERFVATLSHDLRNPLGMIQFAAFLSKESADNPALVATQMDKITRTSERIDEMIMGLLDVSRVRAGHGLPLNVREADLRPLAQEVVEDFSQRFGKRFSLIAPESVCGSWDSQALRRVIENLLHNAVKYGEKNRTVTLSLFVVDPQKAILSIHNWGNPLSPGSDRLFQPHERGLSKADTKGWGLGLALVKAVVDAHGGYVDVQSSAEKGTTFLIELPRRPGADQTDPNKNSFFAEGENHDRHW